MKQRELASLVDLQQGILSKYENGTHPPSARRLWILARALGVPVDSLLPPYDLSCPEDRELYAFFKEIWLKPLAVRSAAARLLRAFAGSLRTTQGGCDGAS
jgi:transcriptional regulator with XRE-family HTH domain